jgi:7-cyano-7-deazaguanine synthase in queuosine biosynthesis
MRFLVQFSGGMDSLASILKVLEKNEHSTFDLLHMQFRDQGNFRWIGQLQAAINLKAKLSKLYKSATFNIITPIISVNQKINKRDVRYKDVFYYQMFCALAGVMFKDVYDFIINGTTRTDCEEYNINWEEFGNFVDNKRSNYIGEVIFEHILNFYSIKNIEIYKYIGEDLLCDTWSCETPIIVNEKILPCKGCHACKEFFVNGIKLHEGLDISTLLPLLQKHNEHDEELFKLL